MRQLREKERRLGLPPAQPHFKTGVKSVEILPEMLEKIENAQIQVVDFSHLKPNASEIQRLQSEGLRFSEAQLADKWQQHYHVTLVGFDRKRHKMIDNKPADMVKMNLSLPEEKWRTLDIMYTLEPHANLKEFLRDFNKSAIAWQRSQDKIIKHIYKADVVPMYMVHFDHLTAMKIIDFVLSLTQEKRKKIVLIWENHS